MTASIVSSAGTRAASKVGPSTIAAPSSIWNGVLRTLSGGTFTNGNLSVTPTKKTQKLAPDVTSRSKPIPPAPSAPPNPLPLVPGAEYKWNLPPHAWSLPTEPHIISPTTVKAPLDGYQSTRRGRIWFAQGYVGSTTTIDENTGTIGSSTSSTNKGSSNPYGFQFVWNPESFNQTTSVNMNITPSASDPTLALTGWAAGNSSLSLNLRIDRTNDFACAKSISLSGPTANMREDRTPSKNDHLDGLAKYYQVGQAPNSQLDFATNITEKITELLTRGTEADLEFLYKTINGGGWSALGRDTSNMGFLMPSLVRVDLGLQRYAGMVSSISATHLAFTRDLIPIRTDVAITIDLRSMVSFSTSSTTPSTGTTP